jgi:hypothetical protein
MDLQQVHLTHLGQRQSFSEMPGLVESTQELCQTLEQSEQVIIGCASFLEHLVQESVKATEYSEMFSNSGIWPM